MNIFTMNPGNDAVAEKGFKDFEDEKVRSVHYVTIDNGPYTYYRYSGTVRASTAVSQSYDVSILASDDGEIRNWYCSKDGYSHCRHMYALAIFLQYNLTRPSSRAVRSLMNSFRTEPLIMSDQDGHHEDGSIQLEPVLHLPDSLSQPPEVSFKIGADKKFVVSDLTDLVNSFSTGSVHKYSKTFCFDHDRSALDKKSSDFLNFIEKSIAYQPYRESGARQKKKIILENGRLIDYFSMFRDQKALIGDMNYLVRFDDPHLTLRFAENTKDLFVATVDDPVTIYKCGGFCMILDHDQGVCYIPGREFNRASIGVLIAAQNNDLRIARSDLQEFYSLAVRRILPYCSVQGLDELEDIVPPDCEPQIYIKASGNSEITADLQFIYDGRKYPSFADESIKPIFRDLRREKVCEAAALRYFQLKQKRGGNVKLICSGDNAMYRLLSEGLSELMQLMDVYTDEKLDKIRVRPPVKTVVGVRPEGNLLDLSLTAEGYTPQELAEILKAYKKGTKYHRLKDGSFASIDSSVAELASLASSLNIGDKEFLKANIKIPMYRMLYLDSLKTDQVVVKRSKDFKDHIRSYRETLSNSAPADVPGQLDEIMRDYQKYGFRWLKTISSYGFGGILADDMGLGKTIQAIALMLDAKQNEGRKKKTSLVVCPSSLMLNWKAEIEKFGNGLTCTIVSGLAANRKDIIADCDTDVLITSYSLIARDIDCYEKKRFLFEFIDEAQYIKNHSTQASKAVKGIHAEHCFALTGTPIENSLAELWSIFDFIMPDYLFGYTHFKKEFEIPIVKDSDENAASELRRMVSPFILRRMKRDVLKELPDKTEIVLTAELEGEQSKLYSAQTAQIKGMLKGASDKDKIVILAMLTKLRQICCDPRLAFDNYNEGSAKLELCMDLLESCINSGHKVLLFSQFTSMLELIRRELDNRQIKSFTLTGETKPRERLSLVNEFNTNDVPVFLISLKAGGVGLNLTGADIVIHYDPWWNISAENQASDRAYRIGQQNNVTIYKLITKGTIEEKIRELQLRKSALAELAEGGEGNIMKMDADEIISLLG